MMESAALTLFAGAWRFADGRGVPPNTALRNGLGVGIACGCAYAGLGMTWQAGICALVAWTCLIAGFTDWRAWSSVARYGGPTAAIALLASTVAPPVPCALYGLAGALVGLLYVAAHRYAPDTGWNTAFCEAVAGAAIIGGLAWL